MSWEARLIRPVTPTKGKIIVTLSDARDYVLTLPEAKQSNPNVLAGVAALMLAADGQVPDLVAQTAVAHIVHGPPKALNRETRDRPWMKRKPRA
ncbi:MAG: hypothetical protein V4602_05290 [Pseudomonadota bacterium]